MDSSTPPPAPAEGRSDVKKARARPSRHRFDRHELRLLVETHREHKAKGWATQVAIYNAEAKKRGWYDQVRLSAYVARCQTLLHELQFKKEGVDASRSSKSWSKYEDQALAEWDWNGRRELRYTAFIEHMRKTRDPDYFRSIGALNSRIGILAGRIGTAKVQESGDVAMVEVEGVEDERASKSTGDKMMKGSGSGATEPKLHVTTHDQATQTTSSTASEPGDAAAFADETGACLKDQAPEVVPVSISAPVHELVEDKLRHMQTLLRTADAALFGQTNLSTSAQALRALHSNLQDMMGVAIASLAIPAPLSDGKGPPSSSKSVLEDFIQIQSKTLMSFMDAKVEAAEARARQSEAQHQQYRQSMEAENEILRKKCVEAEAATLELRQELQKCRDELERRSASAGSSTVRDCRQSRHVEGIDGPRLGSSVSTRQPLSDELFKQMRSGPRAQQQQLATMLFAVDQPDDLD